MAANPKPGSCQDTHPLTNDSAHCGIVINGILLSHEKEQIPDKHHNMNELQKQCSESKKLGRKELVP
ncbi:transmembrane protein 43 [Homo sapiens]|uniref:Transmembrane protein 43 n=1 Tax=Homo sapiens TaxID=9606 RepID=F8WDL3_HUMAN|nr:transmembrane protein 43 [Homo sapiens]KAI4028449.1 transmembrane protein 43 [Homo sapiens]